MISKLIYRLVSLPLFLIHSLPLSIREFLGRCIGLFWFDVLRIRRRDAIENVLRVYPEYSRHEAKKLARKSLIHMGYTIIEFCSFPFWDVEDIRSRFKTEGLDKLHEGLKKEKGVLLLSAHIGNGDLGSAALSASGLPVHLVSKLFKSRWLNDFWFKAREQHGTKFIPPRRSSYEILKALKKNEMVIFVLDQYTGPPNGVLTNFFGQKTGTAFGPALFAQRSQATVIPAYSYRKKFGEYVIVVMDPIAFVEKSTKEETLRYNTQQYNEAIEKMVLHKPEQWMWVHRRWKIGWPEQLK